MRKDAIPLRKKLEALERKHRVSESDVIRLSGIPRSTYRSWKDGTSEPSRRYAWRNLAKVFGVDTIELIFGPSTPPIQTSTKNA